MFSANSVRSIERGNYLRVMTITPESNPFSDHRATSCFSIQCQLYEVILSGFASELTLSSRSSWFCSAHNADCEFGLKELQSHNTLILWVKAMSPLTVPLQPMVKKTHQSQDWTLTPFYAMIV
jgi:hypothetical protein